MLSELFWTNLYVSTYALVGVMIHSCYRSKCKTVEVCCLKITRDVGVEEHLDIAHPPDASIHEEI